MKLYITDLDGTLLNSNKEVSQESKELINKALQNNAQFTVATARTPATVVDILNGINITLPAVMMNGVIIYDIHKKRYIDIKNINQDISKKVIDIFETNNVGSFIYSIQNNIINVFHKEFKNTPEKIFFSERCNKPLKKFTLINSFNDVPCNIPIINFIAFDKFSKLKPIYEILKHINEINVDFYKDIYDEDEHYYLEAYSIEASKANGIKYLSSLINNTSLVCFGDNLNDIPMFEIASEAYAVSNASDSLKNIATGVIGSNNNDSVAKFIYNEVCTTR